MALDRVEARRIGLIKPSALGDIVHALPVLTALRQRFPAARITWVVNSAYESLLACHPDLTDTLTTCLTGRLTGSRSIEFERPHARGAATHRPLRRMRPRGPAGRSTIGAT